MRWDSIPWIALISVLAYRTYSEQGLEGLKNGAIYFSEFIGILFVLCCLVGIIIGGFSELPDFGKGLVAVCLIVAVVISCIYAILQPPEYSSDSYYDDERKAVNRYWDNE